jgi:calmodulin-regulated spectrin-associated protein
MLGEKKIQNMIEFFFPTVLAYPRNSHGVAHKRLLPQAISVIPDLRSNLDSHSTGFTGT